MRTNFSLAAVSGSARARIARIVGAVAVGAPLVITASQWSTAAPYTPMLIHSSSPIQGRVDLLPAPQEQVERRFARHFGMVDLRNGEVRLRVEDLRVPSRGMDFVWERRYTSRSNFDQGHGTNWDFTYNRRVVDLGGTPRRLAVMNGSGREDVYTETAAGSNTFQATGLFDVITAHGAGVFTQLLVDRTTITFGPVTATDSRATSIVDRAGNSCSITRNGFGNITAITDTQDRLYSLTYTDATASQRIASLTDFSGRTILYTYDAAGDLTQVRSPIVTGTPNGQDFPAGKTTLYTYSSDKSEPLLSHNLLRVVEPLYNVGNSAKDSKAWIEFKYTGTHNPEHLRFDRVQSVRWGNDQGGAVANPNLVVGGTTRFYFQDNLAGDSDAPAAAVFRCREDDPNGNRCRYYFDAAGRLVRCIEETNREVRPNEPDYIHDFEYNADHLLTRSIRPEGNEVRFEYDSDSPQRRSQANLQLVRRIADAARGGGSDLVTLYGHEPWSNQVRTQVDPRGSPGGVAKRDATGRPDLSDPTTARFATQHVFDYQEGVGFQAAQSIPVIDRIVEGLGDQNGAPDFNEGNRIRTNLPTVQTSGPNLGQVVFTTQTWNDRAQPVDFTDAEGTVRRNAYFVSNGTAGDPSDLEGYRSSHTVDATGLALTTAYGYDTRGNVTSVTDPKGQTTDYVVNQLDQVVRRTSRVITGTTRYTRDYFWNANDDLVRVEIANLDDSGVAYPHAAIASTIEWDILHRPRAYVQDKTLNSSVGPTLTIRTELEYDANMNQIAVRSPEAVSGSQPHNVVTRLMDERDLLFKLVTGDDDLEAETQPALSPVQTLNYDGNGNVIERIDAVRNALSALAPVSQFPGSAPGDVQAWRFDGFDRPIQMTDGEGNEGSVTYDGASNIVAGQLVGPVDDTAGAARRTLRSVWFVLDELNRVVSSSRGHFVTADGSAIGDGFAVKTYTYDRDGKRTAVEDDRGLKNTSVWDSADRVKRVVDHLGNFTDYTYDANSNVVFEGATELSSDLGTPAEFYGKTLVYDGIDRLVRVESGAADVREFFFDSLDNLVRFSDAVRVAPGQPIGPGGGNITRHEYDALRRRVTTVLELTTNGRGNGAPAGQLISTVTWDDNSRIVSRSDPNGNVTNSSWDEFDRLVSRTFADSELQTLAYDADSNVIQRVDQNGSVVAQSFDGLHRLVSRTVVPGAGVVGSASESWGYDGASRATRSSNDDGLNAGTYAVRRTFDSLDNVTRDLQGVAAVDVGFDGVNNPTSLQYPTVIGAPGRRQLTMTYDGLNRRRDLSDSGGTIATFHFLGPRRLERRTYGSDASPTTTTDVSYDDFQRIKDLHHYQGAGGPTFARFQYGYDNEHHRLWERREHDGNLANLYVYDSAYRLERNDRSYFLDPVAVPAGAPIDTRSISTTNRVEYTLDFAGSRTQTVDRNGPVSVTTNYTQNAADAAVNAYSSTQVVGGATTAFTYDKNGNLTGDGTRSFHYDFKNRLVEVRAMGTGTRVVAYAYDADDRRTEKAVGPASTAVRTRYLYWGEHCIEEQDTTGAPHRQYVWAEGMDRLLEVRVPGQAWHAHENANGNIQFLSDASTGSVVERYDYDAFGATTDTPVGPGAPTGNEFRFQGRRLDPETGLYYFRGRHYSPSLGRFLQRDALGQWADGLSLGNAYTFAGNAPVDYRDPMGARAAATEDRDKDAGFDGWEWWHKWHKALDDIWTKRGRGLAQARNDRWDKAKDTKEYEDARKVYIENWKEAQKEVTKTYEVYSEMRDDKTGKYPQEQIDKADQAFRDALDARDNAHDPSVAVRERLSGVTRDQAKEASDTLVKTWDDWNELINKDGASNWRAYIDWVKSGGRGPNNEIPADPYKSWYHRYWVDNTKEGDHWVRNTDRGKEWAKDNLPRTDRRNPLYGKKD